jgi:hypothetical protein
MCTERDRKKDSQKPEARSPKPDANGKGTERRSQGREPFPLVAKQRGGILSEAKEGGEFMRQRGKKHNTQLQSSDFGLPDF